MGRRGVVVVGGGLVTAVLGVVLAVCPVPYVIKEPGPTVDTLGDSDGKAVIAVSGGEVSESAGQFRLTTVQVKTDGVGVLEAVRSWFDPELALVPRSHVLPPDLTDEQVEQRNAEQFTASQSAAELAAARALGYSGGRTPFTVDFQLEEIGGPSAGLMFTLGIVDRLTPADLTGGRIIAGTGTVNEAGEVGAIDGIPQKLLGAEKAGSELFLVPAENCAEALRNAIPGLPMAEVGTVEEALTAVAAFVAGGTPTPCE